MQLSESLPFSLVDGATVLQMIKQHYFWRNHFPLMQGLGK